MKNQQTLAQDDKKKKRRKLLALLLIPLAIAGVASGVVLPLIVCKTNDGGEITTGYNIDGSNWIGYQSNSLKINDDYIRDDVNKIVTYTHNSQNTSNYKAVNLVIPSEVIYNGVKYKVVIGSYAFQQDHYLLNISGSLTIATGITSIGNSAFMNSVGLTSLTLPDTLTSIGVHAFYNCVSLAGNLVIPKGVQTIGNSAFALCGKFHDNLILPDTITFIDFFAFYGCNFVGPLNILASEINIRSYAFDGCKFTSILLMPDATGTTIADEAFSGCTEVQSILTAYTSPPNNISSNGVFNGWPLNGTLFNKGAGYTSQQLLDFLVDNKNFPSGWIAGD